VYLSTTGSVVESGDEPVGIDSFNTTVQLGPGSDAINLNDSTVSVFTDDGVSAEFNGADSTDSGISIVEGSNVLSTDSSDTDATATIEFDLTAGQFSDISNNRFDAGTTVDIVITTAEGTQAETSFIIESPLDPQLSSGDQIRLD
jgi:flagellin FlaB